MPASRGQERCLHCPAGQPCEGAGETHVLWLNDVSQTPTRGGGLEVPYTEDNLVFLPQSCGLLNDFFEKVLHFTLAYMHVFPAYPDKCRNGLLLKG